MPSLARACEKESRLLATREQDQHVGLTMNVDSCSPCFTMWTGHPGNNSTNSASFVDHRSERGYPPNMAFLAFSLLPVFFCISAYFHD